MAAWLSTLEIGERDGVRTICGLQHARSNGAEAVGVRANEAVVNAEEPPGEGVESLHVVLHHASPLVVGHEDVGIHGVGLWRELPTVLTRRQCRPWTWGETGAHRVRAAVASSWQRKSLCIVGSAIVDSRPRARPSVAAVEDSTVSMTKRSETQAVLIALALLVVPGCGDETPVFVCEEGVSWDPDEDPTTACIAVTECVPGEVESLPPTTFRDRICIPDCDPETWDDDGDPATECIPATICGDDEYQSAAPTSTSDRECSPVTVCAVGTQETRTPSPLRNRECTACPSGTYCPGGLEPLQRCYYSNNNPVQPCLLVAQFDVGGYGMCTIDEEGTVRCPSTVRDIGSPARAVASGLYHGCAANNVGEVSCWGDDSSGRLMVPDGLTDVVALSSSHSVTCALTGSDQVSCWGGGAGVVTIPSDLGNTVQVAAGQFHACALDDMGVVRCWGSSNTEGQLTVPSNLGTVVAISAADSVNCALNTLGDVRCWGASTFSRKMVPASLGNVSAIAVGSYRVCAIEVGGNVVCWGSGVAYQPIPDDLGPATHISAGSRTICAMDETGVPKCWSQI